MNIKSLLEESINLFHYLQHACFLYEHFVWAFVFLCLKLQATHAKTMCITVLSETSKNINHLTFNYGSKTITGASENQLH